LHSTFASSLQLADRAVTDAADRTDTALGGVEFSSQPPRPVSFREIAEKRRREYWEMIENVRRAKSAGEIGGRK